MATPDEIATEEDGMKTLAAVIDEALNGELKGDERKVGFALVVFPYSEPHNGRVNYTGLKGSQSFAREALQELLLRWDSERQ